MKSKADDIIFDVPVCRIGIGHRTIRVAAKSRKAAIKKALEAAGNFEYSEKESKYEADEAFKSADQHIAADA